MSQLGPLETEYEADIIEDDPQDTVEARTAAIMEKGSPLQEIARTNALQQQNKKGLLNTSMAIGASEKAAYEQATPIAMADAERSQKRQFANQAATNRAAEFNTTYGQQTSLLQQKSDNDLALQAAEGLTRAELLQSQGEIDVELASLRGTIESQLLGERGEIDTALQTAEGAIRENLLLRQGEIDTELSELRHTQTLSEIEAETTQQQQLIADRGEIETALQTADLGSKADLLAKQGQIDKDLLAIRNTQESRLLQERGAIDLQLQTADSATRVTLVNRQGEIDDLLIDSRADREELLLAQKGTIDLQLQDASATDKMNLLTQQAIIDQNLQLLRYQQDYALLEKRVKIDTALQTADLASRAALLESQGIIDAQLLQARLTKEMEMQTAHDAFLSDLQAEKALIDSELQTAEGAIRAGLIREQGLADVRLAAQNKQYASELQSEKAFIDQMLITARGTVEAALIEQRGIIETELQTLIGSQALEQQGLKGEQAAAIQALEGQYKMLIQTSSSASVLYSNVSASISDILANPDIPENAKVGLIGHQKNLLASGLAVIGGMGGVDVEGLLDFSGDGTDYAYGGYGAGTSTTSTSYTGGALPFMADPFMADAYSGGTHNTDGTWSTNLDTVARSTFDEAAYLDKNKDVRPPAWTGSGYDHWIRHGQYEDGRSHGQVDSWIGNAGAATGTDGGTDGTDDGADDGTDGGSGATATVPADWSSWIASGQSLPDGWGTFTTPQGYIDYVESGGASAGTGTGTGADGTDDGTGATQEGIDYSGTDLATTYSDVNLMAGGTGRGTVGTLPGSDYEFSIEERNAFAQRGGYDSDHDGVISEREWLEQKISQGNLADIEAALQRGAFANSMTLFTKALQAGNTIAEANATADAQADVDDANSGNANADATDADGNFTNTIAGRAAFANDLTTRMLDAGLTDAEMNSLSGAIAADKATLRDTGSAGTTFDAALTDLLANRTEGGETPGEWNPLEPWTNPNLSIHEQRVSWVINATKGMYIEDPGQAGRWFVKHATGHDVFFSEQEAIARANELGGSTTNPPETTDDAMSALGSVRPVNAVGEDQGWGWNPITGKAYANDTAGAQDVDGDGTVSVQDWVKFQERDGAAGPDGTWKKDRDIATQGMIYDALKQGVDGALLSDAEKVIIQAKIDETWPDGDPRNPPTGTGWGLTSGSYNKAVTVTYKGRTYSAPKGAVANKLLGASAISEEEIGKVLEEYGYL